MSAYFSFNPETPLEPVGAGTMTIQFDAAEGPQTEQMPFDVAVMLWPWLEDYRKPLYAGIAVFSAEGQFVKVTGE